MSTKVFSPIIQQIQLMEIILVKLKVKKILLFLFQQMFNQRENYFNLILNMKLNIDQTIEYGTNNLNEIYRPEYDVKNAEI